MAILQTNSGTRADGTTAFTVSVGSATAGTSRVVVAVCGNTVVTAPGGFSSRSPQVNSMGHYIFDAAGGASSWNFTCVAGHLSWHVFEVANGSYDTSAGQNTTGGINSYATPTLTPTSGERELIASIGGSDEETTLAFSGWTNSFVEAFETGTNNTAANEFVATGSATLNVTANGSTGYNTTATYTPVADAFRSSIIGAYATSAPVPPVVDDLRLPVHTIFVA